MDPFEKASSQPDNSSYHSSSKKEEKKSLKNYKTGLLKKVILFFIAILLIVLERMFYNYFEDWENDFIFQIQTTIGSSLSLGNDVKYGNAWNTIIGGLGDLNFIFLISTHIYLLLYQTFDPQKCVKIMMIHYFGIYFCALFSIVYQSPRPYWNKYEIFSMWCDNSYSEPNIFTFSYVLLSLYLYRAFKSTLPSSEDNMNEDELMSSDSNIFEKSMRRKQAIRWAIEIGLIFIFLIVIFFRYCMGLMYIYNIIITVLYVVLYYSFIGFAEDYIEELIKNSTIEIVLSKRYVFYWLIVIMIFEGFSYLFYSSVSTKYVDIFFVKNYLECKFHLYDFGTGVEISHLMGAWFNFLHTSFIAAFLGAVFGTARSNRLLKKPNWYGGDWKKKVARVGICYLLMIPSWVISCYQTSFVYDDDFEKIFLNEYVFNIIHFFLLNYLLMAFTPYLFSLISLTNDDDNSYAYLPEKIENLVVKEEDES